MSQEYKQSVIQKSADKLLETSKTIDKVAMTASGIVYVAGFPAAGTIFIISGLSYLGANELQKVTH